MMLLIIFTPFKLLLLFILISIISIFVYPGETIEEENKSWKKFAEVVSVISLISVIFSGFLAGYCIFYYIKF